MESVKTRCTTSTFSMYRNSMDQLRRYENLHLRYEKYVRYMYTPYRENEKDISSRCVYNTEYKTLSVLTSLICWIESLTNPKE